MELILNNLKNKAKRWNINTWVLCICSSTVITERKKLSSSSFLTWQKLYSYRTNRQFVGRVTFWAVHYSKLPCFVTWPHATATQLKTPGLSLIYVGQNCSPSIAQSSKKYFHFTAYFINERMRHIWEGFVPSLEADLSRGWNLWTARGTALGSLAGALTIEKDFEQHWRKNDLAENENVDGNGNLF